LPAKDRAADELDWSTEPSLPDEPMRTPVTSLLGWYCVEVADELASCHVPAFCSSAWTPEPEPYPPPDPCCWSAVWFVSAALPANDPANESLD